MDAIGVIKQKLTKYPTTRYTETPTSIEVHPEDPSGFSVGLYVNDDRFIVHFEGWHEHFESQDEALNCFAFGLSEACRLCVVYRGSTPTKWIMEFLREDAWIPDSETGLIFIPFWRARRIFYKQNHLLPAE